MQKKKSKTDKNPKDAQEVARLHLQEYIGVLSNYFCPIGQFLNYLDCAHGSSFHVNVTGKFRKTKNGKKTDWLLFHKAD